MAAELFAAVVAYATVPAPWQREDVAGEYAVMVTVGVTVIVIDVEGADSQVIPLKFEIAILR